MTKEELYKLTDILNSEVLGNFMHGGEADEVIAMFEEAVEKSGILNKVWHDAGEMLDEGPVHVTIGEPKEATGVLGAMIKEAKFKEWHKQQMHDKVTNNYVECTVKKDSDGLFTTETWDDVNNLLNKIGAKEGDKVKLVIIKED